MSNELHKIIARQIELSGPISVAAYMDLCLSHPLHGYYRRHDPLGAQGDFTTAPEISQLFGEMLGIWVADMWQRLGYPSRLILCEMGPGRGTLMRDILRVAQKFPGLASALSVHLVEMNEALIKIQKHNLCPPREGGGPDARLRGHDECCFWHDTLETIPTDAPVLFIGNEFFDALPFRQLVKTGTGWHERVIGLQDGKLVFGIGAAFPDINISAGEGDIYEFSPIREAVWSEMVRRVQNQSGAALMIDYGYDRPQAENTFQAVKNHQYADVLENPGEQDLTSLVDFHRLKELTPAATVESQADFLKRMGIELRAEKLASLNPDKRETIYSGLKRLIRPDEMGELFKVIEIAACS